jgi:hypothetical protein
MSRPPPPENPIAPVQSARVREGDDDVDDLTDVVHTLDMSGNFGGSISHKGSAPSSGFVSSISKNEPIVTRRELWSYYRTSRCSTYLFSFNSVATKVYYNGDNVWLFIDFSKDIDGGI